MIPRQSPGSRWGWLLTLALTVFAVAPLTYPGFFQAQSGFLPVFNAAHPADAPHWGMPPDRSDPVRDEGRWPYLLAGLAGQISHSPGGAIKLGYGLTFLLGALGVYAWTRRHLGSRGAVLAAAVYTYLPWRLNTVYVRGAYAEAWLWALWPWLLWALDRLGGETPAEVLTGAAVGLPTLAATFWTQAGLAALSLPLFAAYSALVPARRLKAAALLLTPIPLWFVARFAAEAPLPFADHLLYPFQLLSAAWGNGPAFQLGAAAVGLTIVAVALLVQREKASTPPDRFQTYPTLRALRFWLIALLLIVLLTLPPAAWLWRGTGLDALLTYPWQVLALSGLPLAFLAGSVVQLDERLAAPPWWAALLALTVLSSYAYLAPDFTQVDPGPEPVAFFQPVDADAPQLLLLQTSIEPPTVITPTLTLTLTWQATAPIGDDYTVFIHALDVEGHKIAQRDARPCDGDCPTDGWRPGQIIVDVHPLALPPDAVDRVQRLAVGLYLWQNGDRASVAGRDDDTVTIYVK